LKTTVNKLHSESVRVYEKETKVKIRDIKKEREREREREEKEVGDTNIGISDHP
jgi:hypothetical protein